MDQGGLIVGRGHALGIALHAFDDEAMAMSHVHLHRRKSGIKVRDQGKVKNLAELVKHYGTRIPVSLVLDTDRCVNRVITSKKDSPELLYQAFPNAPLDQLVTSVWRAGGVAGASMVRRDLVLDILAKFAAHGLRVVHLAIGPWGLLELRSLLHDEEAEWKMGGHVFSFKDGALDDHLACPVGEQATFKLETEEVAQQHALAFTAAWEKLVPPVERDDTDLSEVVLAQRDERARIWYEHGLLIVSAIIVLLIGGERVASHHLDLIQMNLKAVTHDQAQEAAVVSGLKDRIAAMEKLKQAIGLHGNEGLAMRAARVASTVPSGIRLDGLIVDPLVNAPKEKEALVVESGLVRIQGTCANANQLDQWMATLRGVHGGPTVRLLSYMVDPEDNMPHFELELGP